jgi:hypothetical protein
MPLRARALSLLPLAFAACGANLRDRPATGRDLRLDRVVLYRNGVGYFERQGRVDGNLLRLKVRKDQINDLLKSLTVVDRGSGKALSVSIPLDPRVWQQVANAAFTARGKLADVLGSLRGTYITVTAGSHTVSGRIVMVESLAAAPAGGKSKSDGREDAKLTLLDGSSLRVVTLSEVTAIALGDRDVVMQIDRRLDATAGESMFQQVEIDIRLAGQTPHDVIVSYVVAAPIWKPSYRVVLSGGNSKKALLQAWAVVDNTSGEDWSGVRLALTSGTPIAFRYDLHTPENIERQDLTGQGTAKRATVAVGRASAAPPPPPAPAMNRREAERSAGARSRKPMDAAPEAAGAESYDYEDFGEEETAGLSMEAFQASASARAHATRVAGSTRFDLRDRVTVPEGSATMVTLINELVEGEQAFLFRPGGSGSGYERNPYRVIRFKNGTQFVLEPGPISVFHSGSFVGEGISEAIASGSMANIPFAVEPQVQVTSTHEQKGDQVRLVKIVDGILEVERFYQTITTWEVKGEAGQPAYRVIAQQQKQGGSYKVVESPKDLEDLGDLYLVPIDLAAGATSATAKVVEQTPSQSKVSFWDSSAVDLLQTLLSTSSLPEAARKKLEPILRLRQEIGRIDTQIDGLRRQQRELDARADQMRQNLDAIKKDPAATDLRRQITQRLEEFAQEGNRMGRDIVSLTSQRLEKKIAIDDALRTLSLTAPAPTPAARP